MRNRVLIIFLFFHLILKMNLIPQSTINYIESNDIIFNPERGLYNQLDTYNTQSPLTLSTLNYYKSQGKSLIHRMYYLTNYRNKSLDASMLNFIRNDFNVIRQAGMKCILRFAYSDNIGQPDAPLNIILNHLEQLRPILQENYDVIAVMQAGFIGAWGEWHSSTNGLDNVNSRRTILFKILDVLPKQRMVQVRTPKFKQEIFNTSSPIPYDSAFHETYYTRTGHHNDCFLASWDDYGTYTDTTVEKEYLHNDCLFVPMGGETCNPSEFSGCGNSLYQMDRLRWSYLNSSYHPTVINNWIRNGCMDEIKRKLGYRFVLIQGVFTDSVKPGSSFNLSLTLTNKGNGALFNPRIVELVLVNVSTNQKYYCKLPVDPRFWKPKDTIQLNFTIGIKQDQPTGNYKLFLNLPDPVQNLRDRVDYSIRFANQNIWNSSLGYNDLLHTVIIDQNALGEPYTGNLFFEPNPQSSQEENLNEIFETANQKDLSIINFPNPFNNSTKFHIKLNKDSDLTIKIYNLIGKEIDTLVNDYRVKGQYEIDYDASNLSSGVYFVVGKTKNQTSYNKFLVIK